MAHYTKDKDPCDTLQACLFSAAFEQARDYAQTLLGTGLKGHVNLTPSVEAVKSLRLRSMAAEVFDYWGQYRLSREVLEPVSSECAMALEQISDNDRNETSTTDAEKGLIRQEVWVVLQSGMTHYRQGSLGHAAYLFGLAERVCSRFIITSADPAWGTRARISYSLALIHRERLEHEEALGKFTASVKFGYNSLEAGTGIHSKFAHIAIARSLALGLAFVHNATGRPDLAFPLLVAAKSMLLPLREKLISCYVDLLYASVLRGIDGSRGIALDQVITRLQKCYQDFRALGHVPYQARAAYNLAVTHLQRSRIDETAPLNSQSDADLKAAETYAEELKIFASESRDLRAEFRRQVLLSRIARKSDRVQDAEDIASRALETGTAIQEPTTDAFIARGEARLRLGRFSEAAADFEKALEGDNFRTKALCLLHLCRVYCSAQRYTEAARYFTDFEKIKAQVRNSQIAALERLAANALKEGDEDLIFRISDSSLTAKSVDSRVRKFLTKWARSRSRSYSDAAKLLQVSRQTFYNWASPEIENDRITN